MAHVPYFTYLWVRTMSFVWDKLTRLLTALLTIVISNFLQKTVTTRSWVRSLCLQLWGSKLFLISCGTGSALLLQGVMIKYTEPYTPFVCTELVTQCNSMCVKHLHMGSYVKCFPKRSHLWELHNKTGINAVTEHQARPGHLFSICSGFACSVYWWVRDWLVCIHPLAVSHKLNGQGKITYMWWSVAKSLPLPNISSHLWKYAFF